MADIRRICGEHTSKTAADIRRIYANIICQFPTKHTTDIHQYNMLVSHQNTTNRHSLQIHYDVVYTLHQQSWKRSCKLLVYRILLCSNHIVPDTTPPPSDEDNTPFPDNTSLSPCCDLDVSLTTSALLKNLEAGEDPFSVLDVGPAIHDPVEPSLTFPPLQLPHPRWLVLS